MSVRVNEFFCFEYSTKDLPGLGVGVSLVAGGVDGMVHGAVEVAEHQAMLGISGIDYSVGGVPKFWAVVGLCVNGKYVYFGQVGENKCEEQGVFIAICLGIYYFATAALTKWYNYTMQQGGETVSGRTPKKVLW